MKISILLVISEKCDGDCTSIKNDTNFDIIILINQFISKTT